MNIGHSSRLSYDTDAYPDRLTENNDVFNYVMNKDKIYNGERCLSTFGPRSGHMGHGVSTSRDVGYAPAQDLIDFDSIASNRNVAFSRTKRGGVNPVDLTKLNLYHSNICGNKLNPENTRLSHPASNYRDVGIHRFYDPIHDPQENIFWNFSVNTRLEAKDNFKAVFPQIWPELAGPKPTNKPVVDPMLKCPTSWNK